MRKLQFQEDMMRKVVLENITQTRHVDRKRDKRKQRVTCVMILRRLIAGQRLE